MHHSIAYGALYSVIYLMNGWDQKIFSAPIMYNTPRGCYIQSMLQKYYFMYMKQSIHGIIYANLFLFYIFSVYMCKCCTFTGYLYNGMGILFV